MMGDPEILGSKTGDDGRVSVSLGTGNLDPNDPDEGSEAEADEVVNLVGKFKEDELEEIGATCWHDYDVDVTSRARHMKRVTQWNDLYMMTRKQKSFPFVGCANTALPLLTTAVLQIASRLYDMLWPADGTLFLSKPTSPAPNEIDRANRTEKYLNWYLRKEMTDFEIGMDDSLFQLVLFGSTFRRTVWNVIEERICSDWIGIDDFVVAWTCRITDPSMRGVKRYTWVQYLTLDDIKDLGEDGYFENIDDLKDSTASAPRRSELKKKTDEVVGNDPATDAELDAPRQILEQHRQLVLPARKGKKAHPAMDGKRHWVIVTFDEQTHTVMRIALREEDDPKDAKRFAAEMAAYRAYQDQQAIYESRKVRETTLAFKKNRTPEEEAEHQEYQASPAQMPFGSISPPRPVRKREVCQFTHYKCFPSEGFYGLGFGDVVGPINEATNIILNQVIDAMTLQNAGGGFISKNMLGPRGDVTLQPGKFEPVSGPGASMKDGILHNQFPGPSQTSLPMIEMLHGSGHKAVGDSDILSGEPGQTNETATTTQIRAEMALKQISVLMRRVIAYQKHEVMKIWRLLSVFMDEDEAKTVINPDGTIEQIAISRNDFVPDAHVVPTADPRVSSRTQRVKEAQEKVALLAQNPVTMQNPVIQRATLEDLLRAYGDYDKIRMLGPPPQMGPPPPKEQYDENYDMIQGKPAMVHDEDPHPKHLAEMETWMKHPSFAAASPQTKAMAQQHHTEHLGKLYLLQRREAHGKPLFQPPDSGGPPGMAAPQGNGGVPPGGGGVAGPPPGGGQRIGRGGGQASAGGPG